MGAVRRYWEVVKLIFIRPLSDSYDTPFSRYIKFKYRQFKLKTNETIVVKTQYGPIKGVKRFSCWNDAFYSFEKIPFAKPPIGDLRFKAPQPPDPWTDVVDCTKEGPMPLQTNLLFDRIEGDEDCLYLNVYTKNVNPSKPLPVMVWIYGGGFETGGTTKDMYSPDYFMQKNIVLISITYRVGPFGFLSLEDQNLDIPGNAGLKDQLLGLKWVKQNCSIFGGNPDNITVFGESAGAASTHYMMISDPAKNLFHKGILMSGCAIAQWANIKPRNWAYRMANQMGYDGNDNDDRVFQFLRKAKGVKILAAEKKLLTKDEKYNHILFPFGPVIEPYITDNCIIPEEPRLMMQKAWSKDVPIIIGGVSYEGLILIRGFLTFKDRTIDIPGNAGLKDQQLGLKWVKENCQTFGGDLNNITIFGESAGAASVHYQMLPEKNKGLFNKAILMSGCILTPWATTKVPDSTLRCAKMAGYKGNEDDEQSLYEFYKNVKGLDLVRAHQKIITKEDHIDVILLGFGPIIEPYESESCIIHEDPKIMLRNSWSNNIPIILGGVSSEGLLIYPYLKRYPEILTAVKKPEHLVPLELESNRNSARCKELGLKLKQLHFNDAEVSKKKLLHDFCDFIGHYYFWHGLYRTIQSRLRYATAPTYLYRFDVDSLTFNHMRNFWTKGELKEGVCHADDLSYTFFNAFTEIPEEGSKEYEAIQKTVGSFVNFAAFGDPNHPSFKSVKWAPLDKNEQLTKCLNISDEVKLIDLPDEEKLKIWNSLYPSDAIF